VKRIASILLLAVLFFNWIGYRFFSAYMENHANTTLEAQLDQNNYDENELISIKVPAEHLAYYNNSKQFDRVDGEIEINGIQYKYVKRRIYNDSLEYLCIPNNTVMKLRSAKDEFFKLVNDLQHNGQGKKTTPHSNSSRNFIADYYLDASTFQLAPAVSFPKSKTPASISNMLHCYLPVAEQPPDHS
jgi:hypothetical protein